MKNESKVINPVFNLGIPVCLLSNDCYVTEINEAFCDYFFLERAQVLGKKGSDIWGCLHCDTDQCALERFRRGEKNIVEELDEVVNGRSLVCTLHIVPCRDNLQGLDGFMVFFFDRREQKNVLSALNSTQQQLIHADKLSAIGSLAGSIAHEFNNPLCGVQSVMERFARNIDPKHRDFNLLSLALEECDRMKRLIRDLQDFNRPFNEASSAFDLHGAIDSVLVLVNKHLKKHKTKVVTNYQGILQITGVEGQIRQVLLNLIKNSSEAMPLTGGEIILSTRVHEQEVEVVIHDNGTGISSEHLPRLFQPFFTTKSSVKGSGLGLSVSYGIIKSHQGDIRVESNLGNGTTFTISLPKMSMG